MEDAAPSQALLVQALLELEGDRRVVLDLRDLTLADRDAVCLLAHYEASGATVEAASSLVSPPSCRREQPRTRSGSPVAGAGRIDPTRILLAVPRLDRHPLGSTDQGESGHTAAVAWLGELPAFDLDADRPEKRFCSAPPAMLVCRLPCACVR